MSRRRGEFEHRTSIFEGAFRAWSHLGGLDPHDLETKTAADLDPLTNPLDPEQDHRIHGGKNKGSDDDKDSSEQKQQGQKKREYPYEALPRSGLAHPFVQAILSPWLGPDADQDAIQLGLTTLRTWWQHRRKGESGTAIAALGTDKMRGVVDGYTRHFFNLAHCLIVNDKEQPPRTLHAKMKELEKVRNKRNKKRAREEEASKLAALALNAGLAHGLGSPALPGAAVVPAAVMAAATGTTSASAVLSTVSGQESQDDPAHRVTSSSTTDDSNLTPLEGLYVAQRRQLAEAGGVHSSLPNTGGGVNGVPLINMKGRCVPGKIDLPGVVQQVSSHATQLAHRGANPGGGVGGSPSVSITSSPSSGAKPEPSPAPSYGDPDTHPVVFISSSGNERQIAMDVDGITCAHCVKIVETVLKGCNGNKSPINGLLDAAADRDLNSVLIRIDEPSNAKRIAFESARNLAMVGYTAKVKEISLFLDEQRIGLNRLYEAFEVVARADPRDIFDWNIACTCPDNGVLRKDCTKHSQMSKHIFEAFKARQRQVTDYVVSDGKNDDAEERLQQPHQAPQARLQFEQPGTLHQYNQQTLLQQPQSAPHPGGNTGADVSVTQMGSIGMDPSSDQVRISQRGSLVSFGGGSSSGMFGMGAGRHMSITSDTTFGRAMSGLSALSIDWENMEDFDVNVDHSAHIDNSIPGSVAAGTSAPSSPSKGLAMDKDAAEGVMSGCNMLTGGECNCGPTCVCIGCPIHDNSSSSNASNPPISLTPRRSSLRRFVPTDQEGQNMQVSFMI